MVFTTPGRSGTTLRCGVTGAEACVSEGRQFPPLSNTEVPRRRYISWPLTFMRIRVWGAPPHLCDHALRGRRCTFALTSPEVPRCRYLRPASSGSEPLPGPEVLLVPWRSAASPRASQCCPAALPRCGPAKRFSAAAAADSCVQNVHDSPSHRRPQTRT